MLHFMLLLNLRKLSASSSTNKELKKLLKFNNIKSGDGVWTLNQTDGVGQYGSVWQGETNSHLAFSVYKCFENLNSKWIYSINSASALAVIKTLDYFNVPDLSIKWPNDILSGNKKISGILIENLVRSNKIYSTIIGAGININQIIFRNLPNATSIKHSSKKDVSVDVVLQELVKNYKLYLPKVYNVNELSKEYHLNLYGLESCTFLLNGKILKGKVVKVLENGKIQVKINSLGIGEYNTGEIKIII